MFSLKIEGLDELKHNAGEGAATLRSEVRRAMIQSVNEVKNTAQQMAPFKTGTLRRSIFTEVQDNGFRGIVAQDTNIASYGPYIEFGTAPHDIYPVAAKALYWKGALYPVRHVRHPGTTARPFMEPALENNVDKIVQIFSSALGRVVEVLAK